MSAAVRILYTGSRAWCDHNAIFAYVTGAPPGAVIIHGACPTGADSIVDRAARGDRRAIESYPVDHSVDGPWPGAGPNRNRRMLEQSKPGLAIAFGALWRGPRRVTGTGHMVRLCLAAGLPVRWIAEPCAEPVDLATMPEWPDS